MGYKTQTVRMTRTVLHRGDPPASMRLAKIAEHLGDLHAEISMSRGAGTVDRVNLQLLFSGIRSPSAALRFQFPSRQAADQFQARTVRVELGTETRACFSTGPPTHALV